jgi:hypothetical protein
MSGIAANSGFATHTGEKEKEVNIRVLNIRLTKPSDQRRLYAEDARLRQRAEDAIIEYRNRLSRI